MIILHIFRSLNRKIAGADVIIPEHIKIQQTKETVGCVNITNTKIPGIDNQLDYTENFKLSSLPAPFNKPDIIIFHQVYYPKFLGIAKQARRAGIPYVIVPHGSLTKEAQNIKRLKKILGNLVFFNKFIKGARAIQYLSESEMERAYKKLPCFVSTNGIHMPSEQKSSFNDDKTVLSFIGRYDYYIKGLDLLLDAVRKKADILRKNNCILNMYGPHTEYYIGYINEIKQKISEYNISDIVTLNGPVIDEEKKAVLWNTDIFIQCSRTEAMPMGILEAMSYGIPVLITDTTTLGSIVGKYEAGYHCKTDSSSIAEAIEKAVLEKDKLPKLSENAKKLIEENFLWESVSKDAVSRYKKIAEN
ncbi:MAG: glycosyltransferase [Clostridia bacterium]|nr:glycosyltransferase [Clostridia bacterium]